MESDSGAWKWSNLWRGPKYSPEGGVVVGVFSMVVGFPLLLASLFFGYGIGGSGVDPHLTA